MAGRPNRSRARPGEPRCPTTGCDRPAGFATDHPGDGCCRRHDRRPAADAPGPAEHRDRGDERAVAVPLIIRICAREGLPFEDAWRVACEFALHDTPPSRQAAVAAVLRKNKGRLEAAYVGAVERREPHGSGHVSHDAAPAASR